MFSLLRLERKQTNSSDPLRIRIFFFLSYSFGIETINTFMHSHSSPEHHHPLPNQNGQSVYPFSDQNGAKTLPGGAAHTYIAYIREYPPPRVFSVAQRFCSKEIVSNRHCRHFCCYYALSFVDKSITCCVLSMIVASNNRGL